MNAQAAANANTARAASTPSTPVFGELVFEVSFFLVVVLAFVVVEAVVFAVAVAVEDVVSASVVVDVADEES